MTVADPTGPAPDPDVLIIGAGMTGINQLYRLLEEGFTVQVLEAGDGVGGTWFWNRYPGSRFDSESYTYGFLFSEELFDEWVWSEHFAGQPEIERYINHAVDKFDLRRHITFGVRVTSAEWDEASRTWAVTTDDGAVHRARHLVAATGVLSVPYLPDVPGLADFRGVAHHTGLWPKEPVDFAGKRVAIVGTSSSGVQVLPIIAPDAASVTVYQRTANWCTPLNNAPITDEEQAQLRADFAPAQARSSNTSPHGFHHTPVERDRVRRHRRGAPGVLRAGVEQPGLPQAHEQLLRRRDGPHGQRPVVRVHRREDPQHREGSGRPRRSWSRRTTASRRSGRRSWPGTSRRSTSPTSSSSTCASTPMVRVTERGIETTDGEREFDVIVWATGFDFGTGALMRLGVRGR